MHDTRKKIAKTQMAKITSAKSGAIGKITSLCQELEESDIMTTLKTIALNWGECDNQKPFRMHSRVHSGRGAGGGGLKAHYLHISSNVYFRIKLFKVICHFGIIAWMENYWNYINSFAVLVPPLRLPPWHNSKLSKIFFSAKQGGI